MSKQSYVYDILLFNNSTALHFSPVVCLLVSQEYRPTNRDQLSQFGCEVGETAAISSVHLIRNNNDPVILEMQCRL